ncbi:Enamine deaminase RidA, house cleaning of reactive enamine intermediates, YjgF/YER057c/UK114 family [Chryseobacterium sp. RU37D]|uniref:RidA family protein n=1 Tax=Chryseobacterium sp. RU37D TaxID=1907397 RepID=UPI000954335F|nr:RidA family protein [Chryseobacterium sp. RU37D]SIQ02385.1 Enamine deaminase RidA, house cleaning of reactive enamine intermediates, YjgF/YER057c/UK114 family [Chryseobacterium sp. RU37D]
MNVIEDQLKRKGIILPSSLKGIGNYASWAISQKTVYTSGQLPWKDGQYGALAYEGKIGTDLSIEEGYECARICAMNAVIQLKEAAGDLDRIKRIIRIDGHIQAADGFIQHSDVLNGASDLINEIFKEKGYHTRSAIGVYQAPLNAPVLIYIIAELE